MLFERPNEPGREQLTSTVDRKLVLTCENQALDKDSSSSCTPAAPRREIDGDYNKPWLSKGWLQFVADYGLRVGDMVVLLREDDHRLGSQFRIEAKRKIILFGEEALGDVPRAN
ncbi:hypothetical protein Peur_014760 [Populus x canadensis]